ncbi:hypothetical protein PC9H_003073 [Pleurotus ostreatus]|uniref:Uncharacterized protein n=1 Tax=Pleurotus ostreatus TaxID=5322 RepID=A0A8H7A0Q9_PLEOS|nr:uncharacterized protein PC9H_003073 [Pleurotus ostreatus]KAF7436244.1 hypothetical protein PC9H_003073 [Pleurotus ostreatus]
MPPKKPTTLKEPVAAPTNITMVRASKRKAAEEPRIAAVPPPASKRRGRSKNTAEVPIEGEAIADEPPIAAIARMPRVDAVRRSPRPQRAGRNIDPTGKQAKAEKAAVKRAQKLEKANQRQLQKEKAEAAQDELVAMEVDESFTQTAERAHRVRRISDMVRPAQIESDGGEFAGLTEMVFSDDSDSSPEDDESTNAKTRIPTNVKKPAIRAQVAARKPSAKKRGTGKVAQPVASGLNAAWLANLGNNLPQVSPNRVVTAIDDEAADSTRPDFPPSPLKFNRNAANATIAKASQRNLQRTNTLVSVPMNVTMDPPTERKPNTRNVVKPASQHKVTANPQPRTHTSRTGIKHASASVTSDRAAKKETAGTGADSIFAMPKGTLLVSALPSIISFFRERYFSTIYSGLYASSKPFDDFMKGSPAFLELSRTAFKTIWPDVHYELEPDDTLYLIQWGPDSIIAWVSYFCKTYGSPIFYEKPVPRDGSWNPKDPNYEPPSGFLRSPAMIELGRRFLRDRDTAALDFGPPRGLFVLLLTSFEKAVRSHKTGQYVGTDFNEKTCGLWVKQYNKNFDSKSDEWWDRVLAPYCDTSDVEEDVEMSMLDEGRAMLPMSP